MQYFHLCVMLVRCLMNLFICSLFNDHVSHSDSMLDDFTIVNSGMEST
jgi:hypothetical protein